ncbi:MAG: AAA family ATPase [Planctomycetota bacterium]
MRTIAIINQKGGCGKTTCAINLAATLSANQHKTLLVDMDPQGHCALGLAVPEKRVERSTADLLRHGLDGSIGIDDATWQITRHLDLVPASVSLAALEQQLHAAPDRDRRLSHVLATAQSRYDFCIIDCPPSIGLLTFNALRAADEALIPVETGYFAMQGSVRQSQTIDAIIQRIGRNLRYRVLPTMYDVRTRLAREILAELKRHFGDKVLPTVINFNAKLKEAASFGQPITDYDPASRGMQDFEHLAAWLIANPPEPKPEPFEHAAPQTVPAFSPVADPQPLADAASSAVDPADATAQPQPLMSRAAELAQRARHLSSRTAEISQRLQQDAERAGVPLNPASPTPAPVQSPPMAQPSASSPATPPPGSPLDIQQLTPPEPAEGDTPDIPHRAPNATRTRANDARNEDLRRKVSRLYGVRNTSRGVLFVQPGSPNQPITIAGEFNGWNAESHPMNYDANLEVWQACLPLPAGTHQYRLVINGDWVNDPHNPHQQTNPFGDPNSLVTVPTTTNPTVAHRDPTPAQAPATTTPSAT